MDTRMLAEDPFLLMRMDERTVEDFEEDIAQFTEKEFYWGIALRYDLGQLGMPCKIEEHGVDNTGELIRGRLPNHNADKIYHFMDRRSPKKVEIKTIPEWCKNFFTFKVSALKGCHAQGAYILVPRSECYYLLGKKAFVHLLKNLRVRTDIETFGLKPCVRPEMDMIEQMTDDGIITRREWKPKAREYVIRMSDILFKERKTTAGAR